MENFNVSSNKEPIYSTHDNDQSCVINKHDKSVQDIFSKEKKENMGRFSYLLETTNKSADYFDYAFNRAIDSFEIKYEATKKGVKNADIDFIYESRKIGNKIEGEIRKGAAQLDDTFCQGQKGVCVGVSALKTLTSIEGLSGAGTKYLNDMVKRDSNGDYIVTLKGHFDPKNHARWIEGDYEVRVSKEAMKKNNNFKGVKNNDYASAIVIAIAMAQGKIDENGEGNYEALSNISALGYLTGTLPSYLDVNKGESTDKLKETFDKIGKAQANGEKFVMQIGIINHEWTIVSIDPEKQIVVLKNPHNINQPIVKTYEDILDNAEWGSLSLSILKVKQEEDGKLSFDNPTGIAEPPEKNFITSDAQAQAMEQAEKAEEEQKRLAKEAIESYQVSTEEMTSYIKNADKQLKNGYAISFIESIDDVSPTPGTKLGEYDSFKKLRASGFQDLSTLLTRYVAALKENPDNPKIPEIKGLSDEQQEKLKYWLAQQIEEMKDDIRWQHSTD